MQREEVKKNCSIAQTQWWLNEEELIKRSIISKEIIT